jgi:sulfatase maturation enzyme AslB (radical SAM superfamily)
LCGLFGVVAVEERWMFCRFWYWLRGKIWSIAAAIMYCQLMCAYGVRNKTGEIARTMKKTRKQKSLVLCNFEFDYCFSLHQTSKRHHYVQSEQLSKSVKKYNSLEI